MAFDYDTSAVASMTAIINDNVYPFCLPSVNFLKML